MNKSNIIDLTARRAAKKPRRVNCLTPFVDDGQPLQDSPSPASPLRPSKRRLYQPPPPAVAPAPPPPRGPYARYTIEPDQMQGERMFAVYGWATTNDSTTRAVIERCWRRQDAERKYPSAEVLHQPTLPPVTGS